MPRYPEAVRFDKKKIYLRPRTQGSNKHHRDKKKNSVRTVSEMCCNITSPKSRNVAILTAEILRARTFILDFRSLTPCCPCCCSQKQLQYLVPSGNITVGPCSSWNRNFLDLNFSDITGLAGLCCPTDLAEGPPSE